LQYKI